MKLKDIVESIALTNDISGKDIETTILYLVSDSVLQDIRVLRRIVKKISNIMEFEDAPVS